MRLYRSINNNIVSAFDGEGREVVVIGRGIGYKAKEGMEIPKEKIDKVFVMSTPDNTQRLKELLSALPTEYIEITDEILSYAKQRLNRRLNENAYFTLADHINFAVLRLTQGMNFQNVLHTEVKRFYTAEYEVGLYALDLMEERLGVRMPEDEAASIALHIFNAEYDTSISDAFHATQLLDHILEMIQQTTGYQMDENSYYCERFIVHLKFLTQQIIKKEQLPPGDDELYEFFSQKHPRELACGEEIAAYVQRQYDYSLSKEEICNIAIHIRRVGMAKEV